MEIKSWILRNLFQKPTGGELIEETQKISAKVYEKIFLDLQQDEIELSHETFKKIFYKLIEFYQTDQGDLNLEKIMQTDDLIQNKSLPIDHERRTTSLHDWEKKCFCQS